jgi:two-component system, chemotaxis family, chemotaxis protein CheY
MAILIVEDNATNAMILKHMTKKLCDTEPLIEADPARALQLCHQQDFDLLIFDHILPGMTGVQLTRAIRMIARYDAVPIIMVTADLEPQLREAAEKAGVNSFLTKPVEPLAFRMLVSGHLGHLRPVAQAAG